MHFYLPGERDISCSAIIIVSRRFTSLFCFRHPALRLDAMAKMNEALAAQKTLQKKVEDLQGSSHVADNSLRRLHAEKEELAQKKRNLEVRIET